VTKEYHKILSDDESLKMFLATLQEFNEAFCRVMNDGATEFTLKLEVHGANGKMIHSRFINDTFNRPAMSHKSAHVAKRQNGS
jgi:hypothetical protein